MKAIILMLMFAMAALQAASQTAAQKPQFEVASIKTSPPGRTVDNGGLALRFTPGRLSATNSSLMELIAAAYRLPHWRIVGGPNWMDADMMVTTDRFNVQANAADATPDQLRLMLQALLADRFKLVVNWDIKPNQRVYELVVAKKGQKLEEVKSDIYREAVRSGGGRLSVEQMKMPDLARWLADQLETPVVDKTGLNGIYKFDLVFTPEMFRTSSKIPDPSTVKGEPSIDPNGLSVFSSIEEQLGLKLESSKGPVEVLVIDSVSKPSEN
jgi:uncharacterized protein (TIGR03435 family)